LSSGSIILEQHAGGYKLRLHDHEEKMIENWAPVDLRLPLATSMPIHVRKVHDHEAVDDLWKFVHWFAIGGEELTRRFAIEIEASGT
jgi:hypothetical protein